MSRTVRRVPADWQHPRNSSGRYIPLAYALPDAPTPYPAASYMPAWPTAERTHWQLYETTSAGTPVSPPCPSPEALAKWLADHHTEAAPGFTGTEAQWLGAIKRGGVIPPVMSVGKRLVNPLDYT
ncbi:hypothetical protein AB7M45_007837 [Bradyrhizobium elkanii]|uniref:hypothetical protein n=1 Tax=Bradyrhizobium elkanii TaxID=29448 RepID=UPI00091ED415|nr:hypothetical protein [Bradyrhizobium elkanii]MCW2195064.1 hypothetical protein [Bradyrhizobium elkanii]NWL67243.1 hypothetical protein [Bradyrhizobium elkanii]OIM94092.1 hypothetical protein BLN97_12525 [Bradyrhizobium elkanii]